MWFILSLAAGLLFAANKLIFRAVFTKAVNPIGFLAAHDLLAGALLLPVAFLQFSLPQSPKTWVALILGILFIFLANFFTALSLEKTEASIYQIAGQLRHVIVLFGGLLLLNEAITTSKVLAVTLIMIGVAIAIKEKSRIRLTVGVNYAFLSAIAIGMAFLCIKVAAEDVRPVVAASLSLLISGVIAYAVFVTSNHPIKRLVPHGQWASLGIAAIIFAVFEWALFTALNIGQASQVTPVAQSSMIFTLIGGYLFLGERKRTAQKIAGCVFVAAGIALLYFV